MSPLQVYQQRLKSGQIKQDILQAKVIEAFDGLYYALKNPKKNWFFQETIHFHGLYIYGDVGRGKTFLMDLFAKTIKKEKIKRQHFHEFMLWFHAELRSIKNQQNPIDLVIKKLAKEISILCLDEFLVHDITDAMLLSGILQAMDKYKLSLITTSNIPPKNLYQGGLQRKKFLPAIAWMQENMQVLELDGDYDHRKTDTSQPEHWLSPINANNQKRFDDLFKQISDGKEIVKMPISINKRELCVIKRSNKHIVFNFETLCEQPRNANDFIQLCKQYQAIFVVIKKCIDKEDRNIARRFITLIDVVYDSQTPFYVLSEVDFHHIYQGKELAFEMQRTISRLSEM